MHDLGGQVPTPVRKGSTAAEESKIAEIVEVPTPKVTAEGKKSLKIVCISDTHGMHRKMKIPEGDVLVHAGDITMKG